ncbi:MAG: AraC family transcriptional regulator [Rhodospirillales bacterium]|nr:AraC family transcriptional regulator [Rhodospirillales bacterium]
MDMDVLSDVCQSLRLHSDLYFTAELSNGFCVRVPAEGDRIRFHLVLHGRCKLKQDDGTPPIDLSEGDLVLVPNGKAHILCDRDGQAVMELQDAMAQGFDHKAGILRNSTADAPDARLLCGFCAFDEAIRHPGLSLLADHIVFRAGNGTHVGAGLATMIAELAENQRAGWRASLARLVEVLVLELLSAQVISDDLPSGVLAGLKDVRIARSLSAIHSSPEENWTADMLASAAGMSRTRFVLRFKECLGIAPIQYLQDWRMARARTLLRESNLSMDEIALRSGYQSMPAFSRRFKQRFGEGPGTFRRGLRKRLAP